MSEPGKQSDEHLSEELVAYLDGELSASESESVESRIQSDEHARNELQKFDRVWNALDELPQVTVDEGFTQTTIEMAAVEAKKELAHETAMLPVRQRSRWLKLAGMVAMAAAAGFIALLVLTPNRNRDLYTNLPVILELDAYTEVRDIEFLQMLDTEAGDWLLDEWGEEVEQNAAELATVTSASYAERKKFVDGLSDDQRADLASKHRRYQSFMPEMRDDLNRWHATLASDPDADRLQPLLLAYYAWVSQQDEMQQAQLRLKDPVERVALTNEMHKQDMKEDRWRLRPANARALRVAIDEIADDSAMRQLRHAMVESLPVADSLGERFSARVVEGLRTCSKSSPRRPVQLTMFIAATGRNDVIEKLGDGFAAYHQAIEERLVESLDEKAQAQLQQDEPLLRTRRLTKWLFDASRGQRNPDVATLEEFFINGDLPDDTRQRLLAMPREEMLAELEHLYVKEVVGEEGMRGDFGEFMRGFGRGRGGEWRGRRRDGPPGDGPPGEGARGNGPPGERGQRGRGPRSDRPDGERPGPGRPPFGRDGPPPPRPEGPMP
ncbi:hypothetical protein [Aeoliella sp.]|uniref:hypothetical protein n=1 Tax=Aeoliella sp. TaxID=2795800 RepID=UPI003CCC4224